MHKVYILVPRFFQNILISLFNIKAYTYRYTGRYKEFFKELSTVSVKNDVERLSALKSFILFAKNESLFYKDRIKTDLNNFNKFENIREIPILTKEVLRENINLIRTIEKKYAILAKTGGTTGISLNVYYTKDDNQRRFANVNAFRSHYGYQFGQRTAWFSGKALLKPNSKSKIFWRTDYLFNIRYYSTFHINDKSASYYLNNILKYRPLYFVGFPSCLYELAVFGINNNFERPDFVKAIFPNAETITEEMREVIEGYFGARIHDQYGSAEGAPHIFQYEDGYRFDCREGFLEVLDDKGEPTTMGRMIVTSYHTKGTPLIRYDIGDIVELEEKFDYNKLPKIKRIIGREMNFIVSQETGKINAGNISNATKDIKGIVAFQIIQNSLDIVLVKIKKSKEFTATQEKHFIENLRERLGDSIEIELEYVDEISRDKSGKFNIIKNQMQ